MTEPHFQHLKLENIPEDMPEHLRQKIVEDAAVLTDLLNVAVGLEEDPRLDWIEARSERIADTVRVCNMIRNIDEAPPLPVSNKLLKEDQDKHTLMLSTMESVIAGFMVCTEECEKHLQSVEGYDAMSGHTATALVGEMFMLCMARMALDLAEDAIA